MNYVAIIKIEHKDNRTIFKTETYTFQEAQCYIHTHSNDYKDIYKDDLDNLKINGYLINLNVDDVTVGIGNGEFENERNS